MFLEIKEMFQLLRALSRLRPHEHTERASHRIHFPESRQRLRIEPRRNTSMPTSFVSPSPSSPKNMQDAKQHPNSAGVTPLSSRCYLGTPIDGSDQ